MQMCKQCKAELPEDARTCTFCQSELKQDDEQRRLLMKMRVRTTAAQMIPIAPISSILSSPTPVISPRSGALIFATFLILINIILISFIPSPLTTLARGAKLEVSFSDSTFDKQGQDLARQAVSTLDFGTQDADQKSIKTILISNSGTAQLKWSIQASNTRWLSFDLSSGTVQPKASFQTVTVTVDTTQLIPGNYLTILEVRSNGGTKDIKITLIVKPVSTGSTSSQTPTQNPSLCVDSTQLEFGPTKVGEKPSQPLTIRNCGGQTLQWSIVSNPEWIILSTYQNSDGLPSGQSQDINVIADTSQLSSNLSPYSGSIKFTSNGGSPTVSIKVTLATSSTPRTPPKLCLDPQTLNFGSHTAGDTATKQITVSNCGGQPLTWNANAGNATWVTLDSNTGTLNAGDQKIVNVTVNTATLPIGSNPATITFSFDGGNTPVNITLTVIPVPIITANLPLPCTTYAVGIGWSCAGTVTADPNNQSDVSWDWEVASYEVNGVNEVSDINVNPPSGSTLTPGSSISITVSIPDGICPAAATINIYSSANNQVPLQWSCPAPTFSASALSNCPPATATAQTAPYCATLTLTEDPNFQGGLSWTASSDINGVNFTPQRGQLYPDQPMTVIIGVPCNTYGKFDFMGPANTPSVPLSNSCIS